VEEAMSDLSVWEIPTEAFPITGSLKEKINFWLEYAILAPSAHNTQPWQWQLDGNQLSILRDYEHSLKESDPTSRETFLSLGAFIENLVVAAGFFGYKAKVFYRALTVHDQLAAEISFEADGTSIRSSERLFTGITKRHTNRGFYHPEPLTSDVAQGLAVPSEVGISIHQVGDATTKEKVAELVGRGTAIALGMPTMEKELGELVWSEASPRPTGMMIEALVEGAQPQETGLDWVRNELDPQSQGHYWQQTFASAPLHIIIASELDNPAAWLASGRVMERVLLASAALGMNHCIAAAPVEIPTLLPSLRQLIDGDDRPQALFRLGFPVNAEFTKHSTRRPLAKL
jgi:nitroreductase